MDLSIAPAEKHKVVSPSARYIKPGQVKTTGKGKMVNDETK
jgi:hypothetical protein